MVSKLVVSRKDLWSPPKLIILSMVAGVTVNVAALFAMVFGVFAFQPEFPVRLGRWTEWSVILGLTLSALIPFFLLWKYQSMIRSRWRALYSGFSCAIGALLLPMTVFSIGNKDPSQWHFVLIAGAATIVFYVPSNVLMLTLFNRLRAPLPLQDGTLCPVCAYCLIGVGSMICPECGTPFTYRDLETTRERFRKLNSR